MVQRIRYSVARVLLSCAARRRMELLPGGLTVCEAVERLSDMGTVVKLVLLEGIWHALGNVVEAVNVRMRCGDLEIVSAVDFLIRRWHHDLVSGLSICEVCVAVDDHRFWSWAVATSRSLSGAQSLAARMRPGPLCASSPIRAAALQPSSPDP